MAEALISIDCLNSETVCVKTKRVRNPARRHLLRVLRIEEFVLPQDICKTEKVSDA